MYTFFALAAGLFVLSGIIYKKHIMQNQFQVALIVIFGTLIGSTIVNGILGLDVPYSKVFQKEKQLEKLYMSSVIFNEDTLFYDRTYVNYDIYVDSVGSIKDNSVLVHKSIFDTLETQQVKFILTEDTIPRVRIYKFRRIIESKWVAGFGLPSRGDKFYEVYLHKNDVNIKLVEHLNHNYYAKRESDI